MNINATKLFSPPPHPCPPPHPPSCTPPPQEHYAAEDHPAPYISTPESYSTASLRSHRTPRTNHPRRQSPSEVESSDAAESVVLHYSHPPRSAACHSAPRHRPRYLSG